MNRFCNFLWCLLLLLLVSQVPIFVQQTLTPDTVLYDLQARCLLSGGVLFYLGTSEWCHCQRDTWMLLPCLLALLIRISLLRTMEDASSPPVH